MLVSLCSVSLRAPVLLRPTGSRHVACFAHVTDEFLKIAHKAHGEGAIYRGKINISGPFSVWYKLPRFVYT